MGATAPPLLRCDPRYPLPGSAAASLPERLQLVSDEPVHLNCPPAQEVIDTWPQATAFISVLLFSVAVSYRRHFSPRRLYARCCLGLMRNSCVFSDMTQTEVACVWAPAGHHCHFIFFFFLFLVAFLRPPCCENREKRKKQTSKQTKKCRVMALIKFHSSQPLLSKTLTPCLCPKSVSNYGARLNRIHCGAASKWEQMCSWARTCKHFLRHERSTPFFHHHRLHLWEKNQKKEKKKKKTQPN